MQQKSILGTYMSTPRTSTRSVQYGSEISSLRAACTSFEGQIEDRNYVIDDLQGEVFLLRKENASLKDTIEKYKAQQDNIIARSEKYKSLSQQKEEERAKLMTSAHTDIENLIKSQREHCDAVSRMHEQDVARYEEAINTLQKKITELNETLEEVETQKIEQLENVLNEMNNKLESKTNEIEKSQVTNKEMSRELEVTRHILEGNAELFPMIEKMHENCAECGLDIERQRHAMKCTLLQLGYPCNPHRALPVEHRPPKLSTDLRLSDHLGGVLTAMSTIRSGIDLLRRETADTLIQLVRHRQDDETSKTTYELLRQEERELFEKRFMELEKDREEERSALLEERDGLKKVREEQDATLVRLGVTRIRRDAAVQNTLLSMHRSNVHVSVQTELHQGELDAFGTHVDNMRDKIYSLERERSRWEQFVSKHSWPRNLTTPGFLEQKI